MKRELTFRKVFFPLLLIIPARILISDFHEMTFLVFGVPIIMLNVWEFTMLEVTENMFSSDENDK